jgi:hypothetical protein
MCDAVTWGLRPEVVSNTPANAATTSIYVLTLLRRE